MTEELKADYEEAQSELVVLPQKLCVQLLEF